MKIDRRATLRGEQKEKGEENKGKVLSSLLSVKIAQLTFRDNKTLKIWLTAEAEGERNIRKVSGFSLTCCCCWCCCCCCCQNSFDKQREKDDWQVRSCWLGDISSSSSKTERQQSLLRISCYSSCQKSSNFTCWTIISFPSFKCTSNCRLSTKGKRHQERKQDGLQPRGEDKFKDDIWFANKFSFMDFSWISQRNIISSNNNNLTGS